MQFKMYVRSCIYVTAEQYVAFFHGIDLIISSTYLFQFKDWLHISSSELHSSHYRIPTIRSWKDYKGVSQDWRQRELGYLA